MCFFQCDEFLYDLISLDGTKKGLVVVNKCLLDYQHKAPAMDLAFCFLDTPKAMDIDWLWCSMIVQTCQMQIRSVRVKDCEMTLLKRVLLYFSKRTTGGIQSAREPKSRFKMLCEHQLGNHFTRAVVYLLYRNPDHRSREMVSTMSPSMSSMFQKPETKMETPPGIPGIDAKCEYCGKCTSDNKKCSRCKKVSYCCKICQRKDWPKHKLECKT